MTTMRRFHVHGHVSLLIYTWLTVTWTSAAAIDQALSPLILNAPMQNPPNVTGSDGPASNFSSLGIGGGNPIYRLVPHLLGGKFNSIDCLLTTVDAALQLALGDYDGALIEPMVFNLDGHSTVEIILSPLGDYGRTSIPWKFAVWALNDSISYMIKRGIPLQVSRFVIHFQGETIGSVVYRFTDRPGLNQLSINDLNPTRLAPRPLNSTSKSLSLLLGNLTTSEVNGDPSANTDERPLRNTTVAANIHPDLDVRFLLLGDVVGYYDIFYTALDLLRDLAPYRLTTRLLAESHYIQWSNFYVTARDPNRAPRTIKHPPYFQLEWFIRALAQMPAFMVEQDDFREVEITIIVDDIRVGEVFLTKARPNFGVAVLT